MKLERIEWRKPYVRIQHEGEYYGPSIITYVKTHWKYTVNTKNTNGEVTSSEWRCRLRIDLYFVQLTFEWTKYGKHKED